MRCIRGGAQHDSNAKTNDDVIQTNRDPFHNLCRGVYVITCIPNRAEIMYSVILVAL
jgi:hypothetical protein